MHCACQRMTVPDLAYEGHNIIKTCLLYTSISYAASYLNIYAYGTLFVQLTLGMNAFVTAEGFTKISMVSRIQVQPRRHLCRADANRGLHA